MSDTGAAADPGECLAHNQVLARHTKTKKKKKIAKAVYARARAQKRVDRKIEITARTARVVRQHPRDTYELYESDRRPPPERHVRHDRCELCARNLI